MNPNDAKNQLNNQVSQLNSALASLNKAKGLNLKPLSAVTEPISADQIGKAKPFKLNPVQATTNMDGALAGFELGSTDFKDQYSKTLADRAKSAETNKTSSKNRLIQSILGSKGEAELTDQAYQDVDPIEAELNTINDQMRREQVGLQRQIEELEKNTAGKTTFGVNDDLDRAKTASYRRQADLSITQMALQGRYDSAVEQANRKVDIMLERQKAVNDALRLDYEDNKDLFTQAEQRQFETMQSDRERGLDAEEAELKAVNELALNAQRNGAPTSLVQQALGANTQAEALALVGGYVDRLDRQIQQAQLTKLNQDIATARNELVTSTGITPEQAERKIEVVTLANELAKSDATGKKSAVGASLAKFLPFGQSLGLQGNRTAFESKVNTLKSNLTLDNLKLLKGAMSDKDLMFLNSIGSSLDVNMSEAQFDKELGRVITKLDPDKTITNALSGPTQQTRVLNGKTYVQVPGGWKLQQ